MSKSLHISHSALITVSTITLQVSAFDTDQDHDTKIKYSFAPGYSSYQNLFMIQEFHGWITSLVPLDREEQSTYEFYVQASDEDSRGPLFSQAKVVVTLLDANDCPPTFANSKIIGMRRCDVFVRFETVLRFMIVDNDAALAWLDRRCYLEVWVNRFLFS